MYQESSFLNSQLIYKASKGREIFYFSSTIESYINTNYLVQKIKKYVLFCYNYVANIFHWLSMKPQNFISAHGIMPAPSSGFPF